MRHYLLLIILFVTICIGYGQVWDNIAERKLILKLKDAHRGLLYSGSKKTGSKKLDMIFENIGVVNITRIYPNHSKPERKYNNEGCEFVDLSLIYELDLEKDILNDKVILYLMKTGFFEYVEPRYVHEVLDVPNDPQVPNQYYLDLIQAYAAWDICKGDSEVVVGIVDTGFDFANTDLLGQVAYNSNDPFDGVDNDFDGYIDNFNGWDMGDNDNNPQFDEIDNGYQNGHGICVSGIASARTNNSTGMAGPGYRTKLLPVKASDKYNAFIRGYEGIVYAADHGCDIINNSWGGTIGNKYGQDIVNYATFNKNCLVVASAGNSHNDGLLYPASYENVISVAATNSYDYKWTPSFDGTTGGSNYGYHVDVCAPGAAVLIPYIGGTFEYGFGTSFAAPIVSGVAGIISAHYDTLTALQIGEILRVTTDIIDTISFNSPYAGLLGSGRINMLKALTDTLPPSVRFNNIRYNSDALFSAQMFDTVNITGRFTNYLNPSVECSAIISSTSPHIEIIEDSVNLGALNTMDTINNQSDPFKIRVLPGYGYNEMVAIKITFSDTNLDYNAFEYFDFILNPSYYHMDTNKFEITIGSNGRLSYADYYPLVGEGCFYNDAYNLSSYINLLVGVNEDSIANCFSEESDFKTLSTITERQNPVFADCEVETSFKDELFGNNLLGVNINMEAFAWQDVEYEDFVVLNYEVINTNSHSLNGFYLSLYTDFDLGNYKLNTFEFDSGERMAYSKSNDGSSLYAGVKLLSNQSYNFYAFDVIDGGLGGINLWDGFTDAEIYESMTTSRLTAGFDSINDVSGVLSAGPFYLGPDDTVSVSFALLAGIHYNELLESASNAQYLYDSLFTGIENVIAENEMFTVYPVPSKHTVTVNISANKFEPANIEITDLEGRLMIKREVQLKPGDNSLEFDISGLRNGVYFIRYKGLVKKIIVSA